MKHGKLIEAELAKLNLNRQPQRLYEPIRYMLTLGGKRLRPQLMLHAHEVFEGNIQSMMKPAAGIEVFHNFTLLHDDIMDKAPLRRSMQTVHKKWNPDIAILSGDTMFVVSCQLMMQVKDEYIKPVLELFFKTAIDVCEGQQSDMDYERQELVSIEEYLNMIRLKTASLLGCATSIGALCAGASMEDTQHLYEFGKNIGIAFQLHDDILDSYGDPKKFGKQIGGDIVANKKTILLILALQKAHGTLQKDLLRWLNTSEDPAKKIEAIMDIYRQLDILKDSSELMESYFKLAIHELELVNMPSERKEPLIAMAEVLMVREK